MPIPCRSRSPSFLHSLVSLYIWILDEQVPGSWHTCTLLSYVVKRFSRQETFWEKSIFNSNSKELVDKRALSYHLSFNSLDLAFPNHIHRFVFSQSSSRRIEWSYFPSLLTLVVLSAGALAPQMLFKYFLCRNSVISGSVSLAFKVSIAFGYAAFLSTVSTRDNWVCVAFNVGLYHWGYWIICAGSIPLLQKRYIASRPLR